MASRGAPVNSGLPGARDRGRGLDSFPMRADPPTLTARRHGPLKGRVRVPGDKSISHRALIIGALAVGETAIGGLLEGEDVLNTAKALRALGAQVERPAAGEWRVRGVGVGGFAAPAAPLDFGNSGTGCRLMLGAVAGCPITATFDGDASLRTRPMQRVLDPLHRIGARTLAVTAGRLPLTLAGARDAHPYRVRAAGAVGAIEVGGAACRLGSAGRDGRHRSGSDARPYRKDVGPVRRRRPGRAAGGEWPPHYASRPAGAFAAADQGPRRPVLGGVSARRRADHAGL